jgi:hypothetical protein
VTAPKLATSTPSGRVYTHPVTGEQVPSVTTVIGVLDKPALVPWAAKMAAEYADKQWALLSELSSMERIELIKGAHKRRSATAADLGTAVHDAVDAWCTGRPMPRWEDGVAEFMDQFVDFLEHRKPRFLMNEVTVWNRTVGYAGTFDWLADINGRVTLGDTKTGKGVYGEVALQLTALARAEFILHPDGREEALPAAELTGVLHLRPRSWALIPVECGDETWEAFKAATCLQRWTVATKPNVLGARLKGVPS